MGMARVELYPVPRVKKVGYSWRVIWCEANNTTWYHEFPTWKQAIDYVVKVK